MEELLNLIPGLLSSVGGKLFDHFLDRSDYNYTLNATSIPAQVKQFKQAGLNPALAYGQISAPQGQALSSGHTDPAEAARDLAQIPMIRQEMATQKAQEDYYQALADRTNAEATHQRFVNLHQEDMYNLDFEGKTLFNIGTNLDNTSKFLHNVGQVTENDIRKIDLKMKNFDWDHYSETKAAELTNIVANAGLKFALAKTENTLRDARLREIQENTKNLIRMRVNMIKQGFLFDNQSNFVRFDSLLKQTEHLYLKWLTKDNSDWSKYNQRQWMKTYGSAISSGLSGVIGLGSGLLLRGLKSGVAKTITNHSIPAFSGDDGDYSFIDD